MQPHSEIHVTPSLRPLPAALQDALDATVERATTAERAAYDAAVARLMAAVGAEHNETLWNLIDNLDGAANIMAIRAAEAGYRMGRPRPLPRIMEVMQ